MDISDLERQLDRARTDAEALIYGLSEECGAWRSTPGVWNVAECLDHLATANRVYLASMQEPALRARRLGKMRRGPAKPGLVGGWFVRSLEPPVKRMTRMRAPRKIVPRVNPPLHDAFIAFLATHDQVRAFVGTSADLDLNSIRFPNPIVRGIFFSVATGLHVIVAHERRHLWQAWRVRRAAEAAA
jgi:hypothetical protein